MQATGSDQDKPLGSWSGLFSAGWIKRTHTSLSVSQHTSVPTFPPSVRVPPRPPIPPPSLSLFLPLCFFSFFSLPPGSQAGVSWSAAGPKRIQVLERLEEGRQDFLDLVSLGSLWKHGLLHALHPPTHLFLICITGLSSGEQEGRGWGDGVGGEEARACVCVWGVLHMFFFRRK